MRSSVVLPEPDGPSSATSSPELISSETPCSAGVSPKALIDVLDRHIHRQPPHVGDSAAGRVASPDPGGVVHIISRRRASIGFFPQWRRCAASSPAKRHSRSGLHGERDEGEEGEQRGDREGGAVHVLVVENLDLQRHGVGLAADLAGDHRHGAELAHGAGVAEKHAVEQRPFDVRQRDAEEGA